MAKVLPDQNFISFVEITAPPFGGFDKYCNITIHDTYCEIDFTYNYENATCYKREINMEEYLCSLKFKDGKIYMKNNIFCIDYDFEIIPNTKFVLKIET